MHPGITQKLSVEDTASISGSASSMKSCSVIAVPLVASDVGRSPMVTLNRSHWHLHGLNSVSTMIAHGGDGGGGAVGGSIGGGGGEHNP